MKKFLKIVQNTTWYRQLLYGLILAIVFFTTTMLSGFHPFWALPQLALVAFAKEHYVQDVTGQFSWRNFFFLLIPGIIIYIALTW